jgi:hypothetical protein
VEPDNLLICWCLMRQLETQDPLQIADVMGIDSTHALTLIAECDSRFRRKEDVPLPGME